MTCAAIGAIHYGWNAMSDRERQAILGKVGAAFSLGVELIRSLAEFVLRLIKALLSAANVAELKRMVAEAAAIFGTRLSDITHALRDRVSEGARGTFALAANTASRARTVLPSLPRRR
jgi:hypothetical protein